MRLIRHLMLPCSLALLIQPVAAQSIQKCILADGSVLYQQDVCPAGSAGKAVGAVDSSDSGSLTLTGNSNHQYSTNLTINGVTVTGFVDTGATFVTVSVATATQMHLTPDGAQMRHIQTANGIIGTAIKKVSVMKVGKFELYNVDVAVVANSPTLIGMSALSQLKFANENGNLVLSKR